MGRTATIDKQQVLAARTRLVEQRRPHGIIAIRKELGRGSPQLIAKFLREADRDPETARTAPRLPDPITRSVERLWDDIWAETQALIDEQQSAADAARERWQTEKESLERSLAASQSEIQNLRAQNRALEQSNATQKAELDAATTRIDQLEKQLMQQQDLFESWRQDQLNERKLLKAHLNSLTNTPASRPRRKRAEQLDLYETDENNNK